MISDIVEGVFCFIIECIFRLLIEILFFYTGEISLSVITLGKKEIQWNYYSGESVTKWMLLTEFSTWVGFVFWLSVFAFFSN